VLAASLFHFGELSIGAVKRSLATAGYRVRPILEVVDAD
jgi:anthranilate synthase component 1